MKRIEPFGRKAGAGVISIVIHVAAFVAITSLPTAKTPRLTITSKAALTDPSPTFVFVASKLNAAPTLSQVLTKMPSRREEEVAPSQEQPLLTAEAFNGPGIESTSPETRPTALDDGSESDGPSFELAVLSPERKRDVRRIADDAASLDRFDRVGVSRTGRPPGNRTAEGAPGVFDAPRGSHPGGGSGGDRRVGNGEGAAGDFDRSAPADVTVPPRILEAPRPQYTEDARRRKVQGEVAFDVVFLNSGRVHVQSITRTLDPDLDTRAEEAVRRIKFEPARRNGEAVSYQTTVHVLFKVLSVEVEVYDDV